MTKGLFVTAVGTDVGKTYVTALICKELKKYSDSVGYFKGALSGAERQGENLLPGDALFVQKKSGLAPENVTVSYIFEEPLSPHLSARRSGAKIFLGKMKEDFEAAKARCDYLVAEGSGGVVCPLSLEGPPLMLTDVMKMTAMNLVIVTESGLGSINSAVTTAAYAQSLGLTVRGFIMNRYDAGSFLCGDNLHAMELLTGLPVLATVVLHGKSLCLRKGDSVASWMNEL